MDFNIGAVLWFGARAKGLVYGSKAHDAWTGGYQSPFSSPACRYVGDDAAKVCSAEEVSRTLLQQGSFAPYTSHARVLLVGVGADELLAGYGRHRRAFQSRGQAEAKLEHADRLLRLRQELEKDFRRLWRRNLGEPGVKA